MISSYPAGTRLEGVEENGDSSEITAAELRGPLGMFGEYRVSQSFQIIELKSTHGVSAFRDITTVAGTGAITNSNGEFELSTGTTTGSTAQLDSAERGRYIPGVEAQCGLGVRLNHTFTSDQFAEWGYFDDDNGFGFGTDATGIYVFYKRAGSKTKIYQSNWNVDKLDGSGGSGNISEYNLDLSEGHVFEIDFVWYGYGTVEWRLLINDADTQRQYSKVVHRFNPSGTNSIADPNLPIRAYVDNGSTSTDIDLYVGGRQFSVFTTYSPNRRVNGEYRLDQSIGASTAFVPTVSFRRKTDAKSKGVSVKVAGVGIITDQDIVWELRLASSLTSASFGTPTDVTATETAVETDTSATALTGGEFLGGGLLSASGSGSKSKGSSEVEVVVDLPNSDSVTLCIRPVDATTSPTVSVFLRWREEW